MLGWLKHPGHGAWIGAMALAIATATPSPAAPAAPALIGLPSQGDAAANPVSPRKPAPPEKLTPALLRSRAAAAEAAGDWEAAFAAYCELHAIDRSAPLLREKLNAALRRVQQLRRHNDAVYRKYVASLSVRDASNIFAEVVEKVPGMFADAGRSTPQQLWANGIEELDRALGNAAFRKAFLADPAAAKIDEFRTRLRKHWSARTVEDAREARAAVRQLIAAAQDAFGVRVPAALAIEIVCGACSGLDEYTVFLTPAQARESTQPVLDLSLYGIQLGLKDGFLTVESVAPGSWITFQSPQLRAGDRVASINGQTMEGADAEELALALRTPVAGMHEIELVPPRSDLLPPLIRLPLSVPTVFGSHMISMQDGIGYVRISEFQPGTLAELNDAVAMLKAQGLRAMLVDLRGNHGGSFSAGVEVARRLMPSGLIVTTQGQLGQVAGQVFSSDSGSTAIDVPLVVLIDAETASAAEVVAAALRDNNRAVLVGMPTFGKGTIQYPLQLSAAELAGPRPRSGTVRLTIARLIAPRGTPINGIGITPQFVEADPVRQLDLAVERALDLLNPMVPASPELIPPSY